MLLFWGAMIKATRLWGGSNSQGRAYGYLDGGRGIVAALIGSISVYIFSISLTIFFILDILATDVPPNFITHIDITLFFCIKI